MLESSSGKAQDVDSSATYKLRRGVDVYDGTNDQNGRLWHLFKDQLATALAGWGSRRVQLLVHDKQPVLTANNINDQTKIMLADMQDGLHGGNEKNAGWLHEQDYVWTIEFVQQNIDKIKKEIFRWYLQIFDGSCLTKVRTYGPDRVQEIYNEFDKVYGKSTKQDLHEKELKFEAGLVKADGKQMQTRDDLPEMIRLWEKSQEELKRDFPSDQHAGNEYLTEKKLVQVIVKNVHASYASCIESLRFKMFMLHCTTLTAAQQQEEHEKGPKGWLEFELRLGDLKDALIHQYRQHCDIWDAEGGTQREQKKAKVLSFGATEVISNGCWDCGSNDHRRGDSACPSPGQLLKAPQWLIDKTKSGTADVRPSAAKKPRSQPTCRYWKKTGTCKFGKHCKFPHPESEKGSEKNEKSNARLSDKKANAKKQSRMAKFTNEMSKIMVAATKEAAKSTDTDSVEQECNLSMKEREKRMKVLISQAGKVHNIFMIKGVVGKQLVAKSEGSSVVNQYGTACIDYGLLVNKVQAHGENSVALDNCAKVTASNQRKDFLKLDTSEEACNSARIVGVGGEAQCGGRGILMVVLSHGKNGTWVLVDPDAIYLKQSSEDEPSLRCVAANKLEDHGVVIQKDANVIGGVVTNLRDLRSDLTVPVLREDGITVLRTVNRDTRNYKKNRALWHAIALIKEGRHCPIFNLQQLTQTVTQASFRPPFKNTKAMFDAAIGNEFTATSLKLHMSNGGSRFTPPVQVYGQGRGGGKVGAKGGKGKGKWQPQEQQQRQRMASLQTRESGAGDRPTTGGISVRRYSQEDAQRNYDQLIGQGMGSPVTPSSTLSARFDRLHQAVATAPASADRVPLSGAANAAQTIMGLARDRRREDREEQRRIDVQLGYNAAIDGMIGTANQLRGISQRLFENESSPSKSSIVDPMKLQSNSNKQNRTFSGNWKTANVQKWLKKKSVGKRNQRWTRTAGQPPPNCKPGKHKRFDDDDNDPDGKTGRYQKRYRRVQGMVNVIGTASFSCAAGTEGTDSSVDFNCAAGSNRTGRCDCCDGVSHSNIRNSTADPDHLVKVLAIWSQDQTLVDSNDHLDRESNSDINMGSVLTDESYFAAVLQLKVELDEDHNYTHNLLHDLQLTEEHRIYVINTAALTKQQRSVLWHYRLGHPAPDVPVRLSRKDEDGLPFAYGVESVHPINCDCEICDKAKFRVLPFKPVPPTEANKYPPFFMMQVDGFGGQKSMGPEAAGIDDDDLDTGDGSVIESFACTSIGGAVGGYNFTDVGTGAITPRLYSRKSQFPEILRRFILEVAALQWQIRVIRASDSEIVNNGEVEEICAEWNILLQPTSQGTPEELGRVEVANRELAKIARGMLFSAPHLPPSMWGAAWVYAGVISWLLPKKFNDDMTPYEAIRGHPPDLQRLCIKVFGCPTEVRRLPKGEKYKSKQSARTESMFFVGTDYPSVLVWLPSKNRIYRVSKRKVRCHEGAYISESPLTSMQLKERIVFDEAQVQDSEISVVDAVPTIRSLKIAGDGSIDPGESPDTDPLEPHLENNESIDAAQNVQLRKMLTAQLRKALSEPSLLQQLANLVSKGQRDDGFTNSNDGLDEEQTGTEQGSKKQTKATVNSPVVGPYKLRERSKSKQPENEPLDEAATQAVKSAITEHKSKLPPLYRAKPGTRVKILTKLFDPNDNPGHYSKGKPKITYGTIRSVGARGVLNVLWDGENRQIGSHWKDMQYLTADEDPKAADQVPVLYSQIYEGKSMIAPSFNQYFQSMAKAVGLSEWSEPYRSIATAEVLMVNAVVLKSAGSVKRPKEWPRTFMECLLSPDWREWLEAVQKEFRGWEEFQAAEEVSRASRDPDHALVRIGELCTVKRDNSKKFRPYCMGNLLQAHKHFFSTFSGTVTADTIRFFFSLATELLKTIWQADAKCAYLQSDEQPIPIYCLKPTFWDFVHMSIEELMMVRKYLLKLQEQQGTSAVRKLARTINDLDNIILLKKPLYGIPSAGHSWAMTLQRHLTGPVMQMKRSEVDGCLYFKTSNVLTKTPGPYKEQAFKALANMPQGGRVDGKVVPHRRETVWANEYLMMLTWTDDFPYFGTKNMVDWFNVTLPSLIKVDLVGECRDFISIEVTQHNDGSKEATHSKYWLALGVKYADQLKGRNMKVPMKPGVDKQLLALKPTPEQHEAVADYPYRELVGSISFPSCHTKLEIRLAVSLISRHLHDWDAICINAALDCLSYCVNTHDIGALWSPKLDPHGSNVPYGYADSGFSAPRSQGGRIIKMNCGPVSAASQRHSTTDTSTTGAELKEAYLLSNDVCGIRNLMQEIGLDLPGPTKIYEDNMPSIQIIEGERNMADTTRSLEINLWKLRERCDMQQIEMVFCRTYDQLADNLTKANPTELFKYLRDCMNGYAAALLHNPQRKMPLECVTLPELQKMLNDLQRQDDEKAEKAAQKAKEKRRKTK